MADGTRMPGAPRTGAAAVDASRARELRVLELGNDWFSERSGGLNRLYGELVRSLPEVGVAVRGLVVGGEKAAAESGGTVQAFATAKSPVPLRLWKARQATRRELKAFRPEVVAAHFALYAAPSLDRLGKLPFVVHFHGPWAAEGGVEGSTSMAARVQRALEHAVYRRARHFVVLSEAFRGELVRRYGVDGDRVRLVPGGIDAERFNDRLSRTEAREQLGWPTDRPIIVCVRRQMRRMGLENLVDAVAKVQRRVPEVLVMLAGTGPLVAELRERIAAKGLEQHIRQLGRVEDSDLPVAYRAADLSIVPTQALEGFGMITLESLASGTPVLVTPVGGLPEVVRPFAPECILADSSVDTIADALSDFLSGARALPDSAACRSYAEANFAWPVIAARTRAVYEEALR